LILNPIVITSVGGYLEPNHGDEKETRLCGLFGVGVLTFFIFS
tara:strand:+ start:3284 stop:3412 length:129 start_codon:yes stop_codon:yes gene_type:complete